MKNLTNLILTNKKLKKRKYRNIHLNLIYLQFKLKFIFFYNFFRRRNAKKMNKLKSFQRMQFLKNLNLMKKNF